MDLNKVKNNFKYIIIAVIVIILAVSLFLYLVGKNKNSQSVKSLNIKNISAKQYYVKKNPTVFSGFTISSIGTTIFVNITKSPCTQYRSEAIKYLNEFKKTNTPLSVKFIIQGNSLNVPLSCFKSYTLK